MIYTIDLQWPHPLPALAAGCGDPLKSCYFLIWSWCCISNQSVDSRKGRKERKQGKKSGPAKATSTCGVDGGLPDMGALCIWSWSECMSNTGYWSALQFSLFFVNLMDIVLCFSFSAEDNSVISEREWNYCYHRSVLIKANVCQWYSEHHFCNLSISLSCLGKKDLFFLSHV